MADTPQDNRPENQLANSNRDTLNIRQPGEQGSQGFNWETVRQAREAAGRKSATPDPSVGFKDVALSAAAAPLDLVKSGAEVFRAGNDILDRKAQEGAAANPNPLGIDDQMMQVMRRNQGNAVSSALDSGVQAVGNAAGSAADSIKSGMSQGAQQAAAMPFVEKDKDGNLKAGAGLFDKDAWIINAVPTITQLLTTGAFAGLSGAAARNAVEQSVYKRLSATLPDDIARSTAKEAAEKAGAVAGKTAFVGANTVSAQGAGGTDMRQQINDLSFDELMQSPTFQTAFGAIDADPANQNMDDTQKLTLARQQVADQAASAVTADPRLLAANIAASTLGDHTILSLLTKKGATSGFIAGVATGALSEGATEFGQGASQRYVQNQQLIDTAGQNVDPMQGVVETGASNAVLGAGIGGAAGAVGGVRARRAGNETPPPAAEEAPAGESSPEGAPEGSVAPVPDSPSGPASTQIDGFRDTPAYLRNDPRIQGFAEDSDVQQALAQEQASPTAADLIQQQIQGGDQGYTPDEIRVLEEADRIRQQRMPRLPAPGQTSTIAMEGPVGPAPNPDETQTGSGPQFRSGEQFRGQQVIPAERQRRADVGRASRTFEGETEPTSAIEDKNIIFANGERADNDDRQSGRGPQFTRGETAGQRGVREFDEQNPTSNRLPDYRRRINGVSEPDNLGATARGELPSRLQFMSTGKPFTTERSARLSKWSKEEGATIEPVEGGFALRIPEEVTNAETSTLPDERTAGTEIPEVTGADHQPGVQGNEVVPDSPSGGRVSDITEEAGQGSPADVLPVPGSTDIEPSLNSANDAQETATPSRPLTEGEQILERARQQREANPVTADGSRNGIRFSRSGATLPDGYRISADAISRPEAKTYQGMAQNQVKAIADNWVRGMNGAAKVDVQVVRSQADAAALVPGGIPKEFGTVHAMYQPQNRRVILVADNLANGSDVRSKMRHEVLAHHGMETVVGKEQYQRILRDISNTRTSSNREMQQAWETVKREYGDQDADTQAHELLAHMAERDNLEGLGSAWDRIVGKITSALRSAGLLRQGDITPAEIRNILRSIARSFRNGDNPNPPTRSRNPDVQLSSTSQTSQIQQDTNRKLGFSVEPGRLDKAKSFYNTVKDTDKQGFKDWLQRTGRSLNAKTFDGLAPLKYAEDQQDGINAQNSAYIGARMAAGSGAVTSATMEYGLPKYNKAEGIVERAAGTGKEDSLVGILDSLGNKREDFLKWIAGNRSEQLMKEGRENLFSAEEIGYMKSLRNGNEALFDAVKKKYDAFTKSILDLQVDTGLLSKEMRDQWADAWYLPYYRQTDPESGEVSGPWTTKGIANQRSPAKKLKGGESNINDPIENLFSYTAKAIDASMKNEAMRRAVVNLGDTDMMERIDSPNKFDYQAIGKDVLKVNIDGEENLVRIHDPDLYRAFTMIDMQRSDAAFMKAARQAKRVLTIGTTSMPDFILRNFMRDSLHSWAINKDGFKPIVASWQGLVKGLKTDDTLIDMMFAGATFGGGYSNVYDPAGTARTIRSVLRKKGYKDSQIREFESSIVTNGKQALSKISAGLDKYKHVSEAAENANRIATYEAGLKSGKSKAQAAFDSRDLMDFSMQGASKLVINLSDMLPFFNARLQGMSKLGRAIKEDPKEVIKRSGYIAGASLSLLALNWDDKRYEELPDWDKDTYWHAFIGDQHIRIPKPFEIGLLFGTLPERFARMVGGKDNAGKFGKIMAQEFANTMAFTPIPQVALPIGEAYVNYNFFTGNPIENMSDSNLIAKARYDDRTSMLAREAGELTGMSPKMIDHVVQGYTGSLGGYILGASDFIMRRTGDYGSVPSARMDEMPLIKSFLRGSDPAKSTQFSEDFYKMMTQASEVYSTVRDYRKQGRVEDADELQKENVGKLAARMTLNHTQTQVRRLNQRIEMIKASKELTPDQKREQIDKAFDARNKLVQRVVERVRPDFDHVRE